MEKLQKLIPDTKLFEDANDDIDSKLDKSIKHGLYFRNNVDAYETKNKIKNLSSYISNR